MTDYEKSLTKADLRAMLEREVERRRSAEARLKALRKEVIDMISYTSLELIEKSKFLEIIAEQMAAGRAEK